MVDETDISEEKRWFYEERAKVVVAGLQKKNINAQYVSNREQALFAVLEMIPPGATVTRGDSVTLAQVGVIPELIKRNQNKFIDPIERDADGYWIDEAQERARKQREVFFSDVFLTSMSAITCDGKLINIDGLGNRVAATIFGPKKVIVVAGVNKIVKDVNEALQRIREVCAPMNAKRHYLKHHNEEYSDLPCVRTGRCVDCLHECRICNYTVIIEYIKQEKGRINVVLVGEELGI